MFGVPHDREGFCAYKISASVTFGTDHPAIRSRYRIKRIYEPVLRTDGYRILVERLWPRGVTKAKASLHDWLKDIAPSPELREWYGHDPARWSELQERYRAELAEKQDAIDQLRTLRRRGPVTLVFAAKDEKHSSAAVLKDVLEGH